MADQTANPNLWTPKSVEDTQKVYADWADTYDADLAEMNYATPDRIATALTALMPDTSAATLDFGCGTGLSGAALKHHGVTTIDGTDISPQMLAHAKSKGIYRHVWLGTPGKVSVQLGTYDAIVATGVISLGAAPPDLLTALLHVLAPGALLAFSYNDPTLADARYIQALDDVIQNQQAEILFREHGPHLSEKVTGSDVIVLRRL